MARYYMRIPENVETAGFLDVSSRYAPAIAAEKVQMYRISIYEKGAS